MIPVFAPPAEHGLQNLVESLNHLWQAKVFQRFDHPHLASVARRSEQFVRALQQRRAAGHETAPRRRPFPARWQFDPRRILAGEIIFIRRTDAQGKG